MKKIKVINPPDWIGLLLEVIPVGIENGISQKVLGQFLQVEDDRQVRGIISKARAAGACICSTPENGYFLPRTAVECEISYRHLQAQSKTLFKSSETLKKWIGRARLTGTTPEYFINIGG